MIKFWSSIRWTIANEDKNVFVHDLDEDTYEQPRTQALSSRGALTRKNPGRSW